MAISIVDQQNDPEKSNISYRDFGELYCQNVEWLTTFIRKNIRNRHEAEDIAHDVFERLIKNKYPSQTKQPITFEGNIRAFISTIARGIIIDSWRKKELERKYLEYLADLYHDDATSHYEFAEIIDTIFVLDQMLRSLEDNIRYAFLLSNLYGKTYAEIAQQLDVTERKVKVYMSKAMLHCMKMRSKLELDQYTP